MSQEKTKVTFIQKLDNYWYHYKWHTLFGIFAFILAAVCITQCASQTEPDAMVMYVGKIKNVLVPEKDSRDATLEDIMKEDYNGDGEKHVQVFQLIIPIAETNGEYSYTDAQAPTNLSERQRMHTEIATGSSVVYLLHPFIYEEVKELGVLRPLSEVLGYTPEDATDEYGIAISELNASRMTNLHYYPEDSILCIRYERTKEANAITPDDPEYYKANENFFRDLVEY